MRVVVPLLSLAAVAGAAAWLGVQHFSPASLPPEAARAERALALPGLFALATLNTRALAELEETVHGSPRELLPAAGSDADSWPARLERLGIDPRADLTHVTAALYARAGEATGFALGLFGRIDAAALEAALRREPALRIDGRNGTGALLVTALDRDSCEPSGPFAVHIAPERVLIADPASLGEILESAGGEGPEAAELARFQAFRGDLLGGIAVFVPEVLPPGIENPFLAAGAVAAREALSGFRALYFGAAVRALPAGLRLASLLEAKSPEVAALLAERWSAALESSRDSWAGRLPAVAALHGALQIESDGADLRLAATLDREASARLGELPGELMRLFLGEGSGLSAVAGQSAPAPDAIDENALAFSSRESVEALPAYDPKRPFAGAVDRTTGPFGVRLAALALPREPGGGPELRIEALATGIPNLGDRRQRAHLVVTSVLDRRGRELLEPQACGPDRNDLPKPLEAQVGGDLIRASKRVELVDGARAGDLGAVMGHVRLRLPVETESVRIAPGEAGAALERAGARLELTDVRERGFAWHLSGRGEQLLHLRALDAQGRPLQRQSASEMDSFLGVGSSGSMDYAGRVAAVEAVFATREEIWEFPFELTRLRPGTDGETFAHQPVEFADYPLAQLGSRPGGEVERALGASGARSVARTGPFAVELERVWSFGGLTPRFEIHAPLVPNLERSLGGMEIALEEIRLRDGSVLREPAALQPDKSWSDLVDLSDWGDGSLKGSAALPTGAERPAEQVAELRGSLVVRLPRGTRSLVLEPADLGSRATAPGLEVELVELGRDRFVLRAERGGERILGARAFNEAGRELWVLDATPERAPSGWRSEFQVKGSPARIEVVAARRLETARFPFSLAHRGEALAAAPGL